MHLPGPEPLTRTAPKRLFPSPSPQTGDTATLAAAIPIASETSKGRHLVASTKRDNARPTKRWSKHEQSPASRRGREHWTVRWIGAAKRRPKKTTNIPVSEPTSGGIIRLSCAATFSRPVRPDLAGMAAQLLAFPAKRDVGCTSSLAAFTALVTVLAACGLMGLVP